MYIFFHCLSEILDQTIINHTLIKNSGHAHDSVYTTLGVCLHTLTLSMPAVHCLTCVAHITQQATLHQYIICAQGSHDNSFVAPRQSS